MQATAPTDDDRALLDTVEATNRQAYAPDLFDGGHIVAAGVRTTDGAVYDGVSIPTAVGRASVCAEPVAVGSAIAAGHDHDEIETCVAVSYPHPSHDADSQEVIPPCGVCRELLVDYNPTMRVIVPAHESLDDADSATGDEIRVVSAEALLPVRPW